MHITHNIALAACLAIAAVTTIGCNKKSQDPEEKKQDLLEAIEHLDIDTIDTTSKEQIGNADVDEVLRHYPELYHATENTLKLYDKWVEAERNMVNIVFVGNDKGRMAKAQKCAKSFDERLKTRSVAEILSYTLFDSETPQATELNDNEKTSDLYLKIMASIADGLAENKEHAKTDEMKSAVGYARRAWADYHEQMCRMVSAVPEDSRARYTKAVNELTHKHLVDLTNRYYPYYENEHPGWLLPDDAADDAIDNFHFDAFHDRDWIE